MKSRSGICTALKLPVVTHGCALVAVALMVLAQVAPGQRTPLDVSLEDLVRASAGRLLLYASEAGPKGSELSLNGIEAVDLGSTTRLAACVAAIAKTERENREPPPFIYRRHHYRGAGKSLVGNFGTSVSFDALLASSLRHDELAATDILLGWMGPSFVTWMAARKLPSFGNIKGTAARDRVFLQALDSRLGSLSDETLARYWRDRETAAAVPTPLAVDLRRASDFVAKQAGAWKALRSRRLDFGSPKDMTRLMHEVLSGPVLSHSARLNLKRLLSGTRSAAGTRYLPLNQHLRSYGLHGQAGTDLTAVTVVETSSAKVVITAHARGYASKATAEHFLALLTRGAVRRLAPAGSIKRASTHRGAPHAGSTLPRSVRGINLRLLAPAGERENLAKPLPSNSRTRFAVGESAELVIHCAVENSEGLLDIQWHAPSRWPKRTSTPVAAGGFTTIREPLKITHPGWHLVDVWWNGRLVRQIRFEATPHPKRQ